MSAYNSALEKQELPLLYTEATLVAFLLIMQMEWVLNILIFAYYFFVHLEQRNPLGLYLVH